MRKLRGLLAKGLERTHALWPDIRTTYRWVHAAARILKNTAGRAAEDVKARYARLLEEWHKRIPDYELAEEPVEHAGGVFGIDVLKLRWDV